MTTLAPAAVAAQCRGTPTVQVVDNRGQAVRTLQYNRSVADTPADELITRQRYTILGHLRSQLDPRLAASKALDPAVAPNFRYDSSLSGRPLRSQSQDAGAKVQLFDVEGGPVWQTDSRAQRTDFTYDALHRLEAVSEQAGGAPARVSERYTYADGDAVAAAANCRGRLATHHDTAGRNETPRYSLTGQAQVSVRRLLHASITTSDWQGTAADWDTALEAEAYTSRQGVDALGRVTWNLDARNNHQARAYNVAGQLESSQLQLAGKPVPEVLLQSATYSAAGQVLRETAGNGVVSEYHYEAPTLRLSRLVVTRPTQSKRSTLLQDLSYRYDPAGNILAIEDGAQPVRYHQNQRIAPISQYEYDALYQLLRASGRENASAPPQGPALPPPDVPLSQDPNRYSNYTRHYQYDCGGNLTQIRHQGRQSYSTELMVAPTSNRAIQQTGFLTPADVDGHFDACGNLRQLVPGQPLSWDSRNQLQRVTQVQRDKGPDDSEWYRYDGAGQRLLKTSVSQTSGTQREAEVIYLPGLELRRTTNIREGIRTTEEDLQVIRGQAAGRAQVRVLHWEIGQPVEIPNDQVRYSLDDQIGSSLLELDQAADMLTMEEYFPFGGTAVWAGKSLRETQYKFVRYSGKERDTTGLYYYGFRYYLPWLGRWLNPDPAGTVDGLNLFQMVGNNPVTLYDVDGLMFRGGRGRGTGRGATASGASQPPLASSSSSAQAGQSTRGRGRLAARGATERPTAGRGRPSPSPGQPLNPASALSARGRRAPSASHASPQVTPSVTDTTRQISTLTIGAPAANDDFYDPNLATRLESYRAANHERFALLAVEKFKHIPDDESLREVTSGFYMDTRYEHPEKNYGIYANTYENDRWLFKVNYKKGDRGFFASDVVVEQYIEVAKRRQGLMGHLPKTVSRMSIANERAQKAIEMLHAGEYTRDQFLDEFKKTDNGKHTINSLEPFGLELSGEFSIDTDAGGQFNVQLGTKRR